MRLGVGETARQLGGLGFSESRCRILGLEALQQPIDELEAFLEAQPTDVEGLGSIAMFIRYTRNGRL